MRLLYIFDKEINEGRFADNRTERLKWCDVDCETQKNKGILEVGVCMVSGNKTFLENGDRGSELIFTHGNCVQEVFCFRFFPS